MCMCHDIMLEPYSFTEYTFSYKLTDVTIQYAYKISQSYINDVNNNVK